MPRIFELQKFIPALDVTCVQADRWDDDELPHWDAFHGGTAINGVSYFTYDTNIDYTGLLRLEETAFFNSIKETEALPPQSNPVFTAPGIGNSVTIVTLMSTTPFADFEPASMQAGFSETTDDLDQILFRRVRTFNTNPNFLFYLQQGSETIVAGSNAVAIGQVFIRKIVAVATASVFVVSSELYVSESVIQGVGLRDQEPDLEHLMRMKRNSKLAI